MDLENTIKNLRIATLLALLFCTALAWVISQQGQVIQGQKDIIRVLFQDSQELNRRKMNDIQRENLRKKFPKTVQQNAVPSDALPGCLPYAVCG